MNNFLKNGIKYARNPLGIIALALVLTYGLACSTFFFCKNLPEFTVKCLTIFIVAYPIVIIIIHIM